MFKELSGFELACVCNKITYYLQFLNNYVFFHICTLMERNINYYFIFPICCTLATVIEMNININVVYTSEYNSIIMSHTYITNQYSNTAIKDIDSHNFSIECVTIHKKKNVIFKSS